MVSVGDLCEVADGVAFVPTFANCTAFDTGDGLFLVDTGSSFTAAALHAELRGWRRSGLHTAVFSHGHIDHVFGVGLFEEEAGAAALAGPARRGPRARAARASTATVLTAGYNQVVNRRQFGIDRLRLADAVPLPRRVRTPRRSRSTWAASRSSCATRWARPTTPP